MLKPMLCRIPSYVHSILPKEKDEYLPEGVVVISVVKPDKEKRNNEFCFDYLYYHYYCYYYFYHL